MLSSAIDPLFESAIEKSVFSGASVLVASPDGVLFEREYGRVTNTGPFVGPGTWFDLASLTKPLVTVPLLMSAVSKGVLELTDTMDRFFKIGEELPPDKSIITIRDLLSHSSGLPAYLPFYTDILPIELEMRSAHLLSSTLQVPLLFMPGTRSVYSDLGFFLLGSILERTLGAGLEELSKSITSLCRKEIGYVKLATTSSDQTIIPSRIDSEQVEFVATENCGWRKRLICGEVHDENAWCLGGIAPHAGLFGNARGIHSIVRQLWDIYSGTGSWIGIESGTVKEFWTREIRIPGSTWALGFDTPSAAGSTSGRLFSSRTVGHLGYTGTSFWLDLDQETLVILLTNRVYPSRNNEGLRTFRPVFHDTVIGRLHGKN